MPDLRQAGWEMRTLVLTDCLCTDLLQVRRKRSERENAVRNAKRVSDGIFFI
ncbi:hypothetical protein M791_01070 [Neisseria gonorrhoeae MU_NG26]|nr:hypothetical protein M684_07965 [Neisseria gonorrhoeae SK15454]KLR86379.1 hypothetical protein M675_08140 [Neisseria gonorrhoeae SK1902]KLS07360.1 hypothetical protein M725_01315 [Neisseria gonorrhoeae ATL_2011_01_08]KLS36378.1 hypothetical protein M735_09445 [Neisseria gonorrhoeae MIA_2011_03-09]KLS40054.1 hypothetical protein M720_04125 [Neisseria gonorrhoeae SK39420]KLS50621.1 hypothetical protein M736_03120 [Neisseria gonorrhoeae MIA_2011_03-10]KLS54666.1 hypothetical protein M732_0459